MCLVPVVGNTPGTVFIAVPALHVEARIVQVIVNTAEHAKHRTKSFSFSYA
jgi:hypothetical protein